ncbi:MAG: LPXTG cell wall anchor domain-containing protein [Actinomycetota bacterium]|nr:LPXTG cell wall anchor domain-containing protein [Actinomycetota bacterium]
MLGVVTIVPVFGGIASAHHSNIAASVACTGTVSWTATSWSTGAEGTNTDIKVTKTIGNTTTTIQHGAFNAANNYQFSGTFAWPANTNSMIITSTPIAKWANGVTSPVGSSTTISKPTNCPGQPGVSKAVSCVNTSPGYGDGRVVLTLTNAATGPFAPSVTFKVFNPDQTVTSQNYTVPVGGSTPVTFTGLADGSHSVKILVGTADHSQTFNVECDSPVPSVTSAVTCANGDGQIVVTLHNGGAESVVFDVTNPSTSAVEHVTVNANSSATRTFSGFADGDHTLVIKVGTTDFSQHFTIRCDRPGQPAVEIAQDCADEDGVVIVTLSNIGGQLSLTFTVEGVDHEVEANSSLDVPVTGLNDGDQTITISQGDLDLSRTVTIGCDRAPTVDFTQACVEGENGQADGQVIVTLHNNGDDVDVTFTVNGVQYTVAPNASQDVPVGPLTDGLHTIDVFVGENRLGLDAITVACDHPGVGTLSIAPTCVNNDGQVTVTLTATGGELPVVFTVQGTNYSVPPNTTLPVVISGLNDGNNHIAASAGGQDLSFDSPTKCDLSPLVSYIQACANFDDTVLVLIENVGDDVAVTVTVNGIDHVLAPGELNSVLVDHLADGANTVTVAVNGVSREPIVVNSGCDAVAQLPPPTPPPAVAFVEELPRTGAGRLGLMLAIGLGCVLSGGALLFSRRRFGAS